MSALDHGKNLVIRLQNNNPSQSRLIIKPSEIVLGISQERLKYCLADNFLLSPPLLSDTPLPGDSKSICRLPQARLSRWQAQPGYPKEHTAEQPSRQVALRQ